jgi:type III pantothenate kinase
MDSLFTIDIGNTRTHCAIIRLEKDNLKIVSAQDYPSSEFAEIFERQTLLKKSGADCVAWCSVVPKYSEALKKKLANIKNMQLTAENSPIELDVKYPSQVGQDRIADAAGAGIFFKPPYIVVDMGTAVTIDLVDKNGKYAGGAIAPGMHAFAAYLNERAAQLPKINPADADYNMSIGKDTESAMHVGCVKGFCKLADGIIEDIERDYFDGESAKGKTVFTGGSIELLPKKWLADRKIESNLANLGLARTFFNKENKCI